jgi:hypothetical protein
VILACPSLPSGEADRAYRKVFSFSVLVILESAPPFFVVCFCADSCSRVTLETELDAELIWLVFCARFAARNRGGLTTRFVVCPSIMQISQEHQSSPTISAALCQCELWMVYGRVRRTLEEERGYASALHGSTKHRAWSVATLFIHSSRPLISKLPLTTMTVVHTCRRQRHHR